MSEQTDTDTTAEDSYPHGVYIFPASCLPDAIHSIEKANRKLERFGITGRFAFTTEQKMVSQTLANGLSVTTEMVELTLNTPALCYSGWEFVATLVHEEAGVIARTVPGKSLDGWKPNHETVCDHCGTNRARKDTYVVRHVGTDAEPGTGAVKQVGSNCITAFLGIRPAGLWLLGFEPVNAEMLIESERSGGFADYRVAVREVIRYSLACSNFGKGFISSSSAYTYGGVATVGLARRLMFDRLKEKDKLDLAVEIAAVAQVTDEQIDAVIAAGREIEGFGEYADNMRVAMASESVDTRTMGLVASAISVWNRAEGRKAERKAKAQIAKGFVGDPGDKITDLDVVITGAHQKEGFHYGSTETIITMLTVESGHQLKWFASGARDYKVGDLFTLAKATVKKASTWQGTDETVILRAKLVEKEAADA